MNNFKYLLTLFLSLVLISCGGNTEKQKSKAKKAQEEIYDYRDEQYQDFYSVLLRGLSKEYDYISTFGTMRFGAEIRLKEEKLKQFLDEKNISNLSSSDVPKHFGGNYILERLESGSRNYDRLNIKTKQELIDYYLKNNIFSNREIKDCEAELQVQDFVCLTSGSFSFGYYYFPETSSKKLPYIDQFQRISCDKYVNDSGERACELSTVPFHPYNVDIRLYTYTSQKNGLTPEHFFYMLLYTEHLIFKATGEHIWQNPVPKNMP